MLAIWNIACSYQSNKKKLSNFKANFYSNLAWVSSYRLVNYCSRATISTDFIFQRRTASRASGVCDDNGFLFWLWFWLCAVLWIIVSVIVIFIPEHTTDAKHQEHRNTRNYNHKCNVWSIKHCEHEGTDETDER